MDIKNNVGCDLQEGELKRCPFCGGEAKLYNDSLIIDGELVHEPEYWWCGCENCKIETKIGGARKEIIACWNRRV